MQAQLEVNQSHFELPLILHTDRGAQFKSQAYIAYTNEDGIQRSMTAAGASHENPVAEWINGILKNELLEDACFDDLKKAQYYIYEAIKIYNEKRPHLSCEMLTPIKPGAH